MTYYCPSYILLFLFKVIPHKSHKLPCLFHFNCMICYRSQRIHLWPVSLIPLTSTLCFRLLSQTTRTKWSFKFNWNISIVYMLNFNLSFFCNTRVWNREYFSHQLWWKDEIILHSSASLMKFKKVVIDVSVFIVA